MAKSKNNAKSFKSENPISRKNFEYSLNDSSSIIILNLIVLLLRLEKIRKLKFRSECK